MVTGNIVRLFGDLGDADMSWNREIWTKVLLLAMEFDGVAILTPQQ
jgi:hypothetical protein